MQLSDMGSKARLQYKVAGKKSQLSYLWVNLEIPSLRKVEQKYTIFKYYTSLQVLHKTGSTSARKPAKLSGLSNTLFASKMQNKLLKNGLHISTVQIFESDVDLFFKLNFRLQCQELGLQTEQLIEFINKALLKPVSIGHKFD